MPTDLPRFGSELRELRQRKGLTQSNVIDRVPWAYKDEKGLRRIENGERRPTRAVIIDILTKGFLETETAPINRLLDLAGYEGVSDAEIASLGLKKSAAEKFPESPPEREERPNREPVPPTTELVWRPDTTTILVGVLCVLACFGAAVLASRATGQRHVGYIVLTSAMYSSLYAISVLLEAYRPPSRRVSLAALFVFCFMWLASVVALNFDGWSVQTGGKEGLWICIAILVSAAGLQWIMVRTSLPGTAVVEAKIQSFTGQAAHLKNTAYFLVLAVLFWAPPRHCILQFERDLGVISSDTIQRMLHGNAFATGGFCAPPAWLGVILLVMGGGAIKMASHLTDNLHNTPHLNRYLVLLYARGVLYFLLVIICLAWYWSSMSTIADLLPPERP